MIGSTLSRMAAAEQLSVPQLQRAIQDGTVPAYVGIPLLQDKIKQDQQAKVAAAGVQGGQKSTVADQVMQQASQQERPEGIEQLPTQAPTMAGGGIIAFADGGDADMSADDYADYEQDQEDAQDEAEQAAHLNQMSNIANLGYSDVSSGQLQAGKKIGAYQGITGDHKYKDLIQSEAKKIGLDPDYALKIAMIESGGLKNPETARSKAGAIGIMQLMPSTAKSRGVQNPEDPEQNVRGGLGLLKDLVDKYQDYDLAGAAYNAGEGRVDRALRSGNLSSLPSETQGYMSKIRGYADGGIAHFADEGYVDPSFSDAGPGDSGQNVSVSDWLASRRALGYGLTPSTAEAIKTNPDVGAYWNQYNQQLLQSPDLDAFQKDPRAYVSAKQTEYAKAHPPVSAQPAAATTKSSQTTQPAASIAPVAPAAPVPTSDTTQTAPASSSVYDQFIQNLMNKDSKRADQADQDKWLSVLTAGLGMMGGTSPYAAANIGQGAMAGISNYVGLKKQADAQEAQDTKNILMAQKYKEYSEQAAAQQAATDLYHKGLLSNTATESARKDQADRANQYFKYIQEGDSSLKNQFPMGPLSPGYKEAYNELHYGDTAVQLAKAAGMPISQTGGAGSTVLRYDSQGNPIK